jgi:hypothetical protein
MCQQLAKHVGGTGSFNYLFFFLKDQIPAWLPQLQERTAEKLICNANVD